MSLTAAVPRAPQAAQAALPRIALPLPAPSWGEAEARVALAEARPRLPVPLPPATLVSALTTVVLKAGEYAVKVYPPGTDAAHLDRTARALAGSRTAHLPVCPPVVTAYGVVTLTRWLPARRGVTWTELGGLLRRFHEEHARAGVPAWSPLSRLPGQVLYLAPEHASVLLDARTALLAALADTTSDLGHGPIHGDVSPYNVMHAPDGPRLIDLDWLAWAPREYDLASAARRVRAGHISRQAYAGFCRAYGHDVRGWPGLPVLDRIADLGGVAFRIWDSRHHGTGLDWLADEVRLWRTPL